MRLKIHPGEHDHRSPLEGTLCSVVTIITLSPPKIDDLPPPMQLDKLACQKLQTSYQE